MLARRIIVVLLGLSVFAAGGIASAQSDSSEKKTFFGRLDDFGKSIFSGILPSKKAKETPKNPPATSPNERPAAGNPSPFNPTDENANAPRAGSAFATGDRQTPPSAPPAVKDDELMPENTPPAVSRRVDVQPVQPVRRPASDTSLFDDSSDATQVNVVPSQGGDASAAHADPTDAPESTPPSKRPLHERLARFRRPVFEEDFGDSTPQPSAQAERSADSLTMPSEPSPRPSSTSRSFRAPTHASSRDDSAASDSAGRDDGNILITRKGPVLSVETAGPRTITVGRESTYEVTIVNSGEVAAEELVVYVSLPEWTEVAGLEASVGAAQTAAAKGNANTIQWKVGYLDAHGRQRVSIHLIPRQSRPFELAVRWDLKPTATQAAIEVREAKLSMELEGPREVFYGKKEVFRLKLRNTGNGGAENVVLTLIPLGAGDNATASRKVGALAAGEEKVLEVELTARQVGNLVVQAEARGEGGLRASLAEKMLVRRAGLKLDVDGPRMQFVGSTVAWTVRVRNMGNASARNLAMSMTLPAGAKYLSGIEGARFDADNSRLAWTLNGIEPGVEQAFSVKCRLGAAGTSRVRLNATADDDLTATAETIVQVDSIGNLTMRVKDPSGPTPLGEEAVYEIRVRNRGTKEAQKVEVFGFFSRGIEPITADGAPNRIEPGQVMFQPIASLAPGQEVVLKVRARAEVGGNHVFRAEVHCRPLSTRLVQESTNLYYGDNPAAQPAPPREATRPISRGLAAPPVAR